MSETAVSTQVVKNAVTGEGYRLSTAMGRMTRIADYMKLEPVMETVRAVLPHNTQAFVASVLNEIRKSTADPEKDLSQCTPQSIVNCCIDAGALRLSIDGRQHAHLIKRKDSATLQIGFRGYLARLGEQLEGFLPVVECVYQGDTIKVARNGDEAVLEHTPAQPFGLQADTALIGVYAYFSWVSAGKRVSVVTTMDRATINKIRNAAKTKSIWDAWLTEKAKVAVVRRACKMHFSSLTNDLDEKDNQDFDLDATNAGTEQSKALASRIGGGLSEALPEAEVVSATVVEETATPAAGPPPFDLDTTAVEAFPFDDLPPEEIAPPVPAQDPTFSEEFPL